MSDKKKIINNPLDDLATIEIQIKNRIPGLEEKILFDLKKNIRANREISKVTKDENIIKNSYYLIPDYLLNFNLCQKCLSSNLKIIDCLHKDKLGYRLTPKIKFGELDFVNTPCEKLLEIKNSIMKKINLFYDDELSFYLQGTKLIGYYIDLKNLNNVKSHSEINTLFDYVNEILTSDNYNKPGYLISSKKEGLSNRILKSIALFFQSKNESITYLDAHTFFSYLFDSSSDEYEKILDIACNSKILLINNIDTIPIINDSLIENYLGKLLLARNNKNMITFASTTKPMNYQYLINRYFEYSENKITYTNILKTIFDLITVTDTI